jgi:hypothetical protein
MNIDLTISRYYRFNTPRKLSKLLLFNDGDCDSHHPGVGDVKFVKDLQDNVVVTKKFECSRFDVHFHKSLGWVSTNKIGELVQEIFYNKLLWFVSELHEKD